MRFGRRIITLTTACCATLALATAATAAPQSSPWVSMDPGIGGPWTVVEATDSSHVWVAGSSAVARSTDGGASWERQVTLPAGVTVMDIDFGAAGSGWAVGRKVTDGTYGPFILHSTDGGATWDPYDATALEAAPGPLDVVEFIDQDHGWIGGGGFWQTSDGGKTWISRPDPPAVLHDLQFADTTTGFACGYWSASGSPAFRTTDGGQTWVDLGVLGTGDSRFLELAFVDALHGFAGNLWGDVGVTSNGGSTWTRLECPASSVSDLAAVDAAHVWVVDDGAVYASGDGGTTWRKQRAEVFGSSNPWAALAVKADSAWLLSDTGYARTTTDGLSDPTPPVTTVAGPRFITETTTYGLSATDVGTGLASTWARLDGGGWVQTASVEVVVAAGMSGDEIHTIEASSSDLYGNWETPSPFTIVVDRMAPDIDFVPPEPERLGEWTNRVAHVAVLGDDGQGVGTSEVFVGVDDGKVARHADGWVVVTQAPKTHANDGVHVISAHAVDGFGHVGPERSCRVMIDTRRPALKTSGVARVLLDKGRVLFSASDAKPCAGTYRVKYLIKNRSGKVVQSSSWGGAYKVGRAYALKFDCKLRKGVYSMVISAQDAAGNVATRTLKLYVDYLTVP